MTGDPRRDRGPHRVLWLTKGLGLGGTEQLVRLCAPRFDRDRFRVDVAYVLPHKDELAPALRDAGLDVICLTGGDRPGGWPVSLWRFLRSRPYDLVHTHSPVPAAVARTAVSPEVTVVHTEHNVWGRYRPPTRLANAATLGRNARVFAVSSAVATSIRSPGWGRNGGPPVEVLHHGIDEGQVQRGGDARAEARRRLGLGQDEAVIGTVGNFTPKKDQATLLRGFHGLLRSGIHARLVLIGGGPLRSELEATVREFGMEDRVLFTGRRDDVPALLPGFDLFVLTSVHEGLPIALLEAMASGLACVVTPVGGTPEMIVDGQNGVLVPCRDPGALTVTLSELLPDPATRRRLGAAAVETSEGFSIEAAVDRMQQAYEELLTSDHHAVAT